MGRRGPAPQGEYSGKSGVLSTRIRPDTRAKLEEAAKASGRSLSQEIEYRLRRTFLDDEKIADAFGSRRNYALMRLIGSIIESMMNLKQRDADWIEDPYLFDQVAKSIFAVLEAIRPEGDLPSTIDDALDHGGRLQWKWRAAETLREVKLADPALPLDEKSNNKRLASRLKADLGSMIDRVDTGHRNVPGTTMDILDEGWPTKKEGGK